MQVSKLVLAGCVVILLAAGCGGQAPSGRSDAGSVQKRKVTVSRPSYTFQYPSFWQLTPGADKQSFTLVGPARSGRLGHVELVIKPRAAGRAVERDFLEAVGGSAGSENEPQRTRVGDVNVLKTSVTTEGVATFYYAVPWGSGEYVLAAADTEEVEHAVVEMLLSFKRVGQ